MVGRMDGWEDGWIRGWMDERMDGWEDWKTLSPQNVTSVPSPQHLLQCSEANLLGQVSQISSSFSTSSSCTSEHCTLCTQMKVVQWAESWHICLGRAQTDFSMCFHTPGQNHLLMLAARSTPQPRTGAREGQP